jgi:hypothetical protein
MTAPSGAVRNNPEVGEGLSAGDLGKEISHHARHAGGQGRQDRALAIVEALLLSIVTIVAAWSGFSAAKWGTESSIALAQASTARTNAARAFQESVTFRAFDTASFNAWFTAYIAGDEQAMAVAERRFRPQYQVAFDAWLATDPFNNPDAPAGPQLMPQYVPTGLTESRELDEEADELLAEGEHAGETSDEYVRTTVILASVLFLVGISTQFPLRAVRYGLIAVGTCLLIFGGVLVVLLPSPP